MSPPCGDCGATKVEMFMTCMPRCVNKEACALRKLRDLRAAVGVVAQHATATGDLYVAAELRKACRESDR